MALALLLGHSDSWPEHQGWQQDPGRALVQVRGAPCHARGHTLQRPAGLTGEELQQHS